MVSIQSLSHMVLSYTYTRRTCTGTLRHRSQYCRCCHRCRCISASEQSVFGFIQIVPERVAGGVRRRYFLPHSEEQILLYLDVCAKALYSYWTVTISEYTCGTLLCINWHLLPYYKIRCAVGWHLVYLTTTLRTAYVIACPISLPIAYTECCTKFNTTYSYFPRKLRTGVARPVLRRNQGLGERGLKVSIVRTCAWALCWEAYPPRASVLYLLYSPACKNIVQEY